MPDTAALLAAMADLQHAQPEPLRMEALLRQLGPEAVFRAVGLEPDRDGVSEPPPVTPAALFGLPGAVLALAPAFGSLTGAALTAIVEGCRRHGAADLRLTPWRVLLATGGGDRHGLLKSLSALDLILDRADPRLSVSACVGAPSCHRASTPARVDAGLIAGRLGQGFDKVVHVAGCAKGCARPTRASWTLVARDGLYDVQALGEAAPRVTGLSSTAAANWLSRAERARVP